VHSARDDVSTAKVLGAIAVESALGAGQIEMIAEDVLTTPVESIRRMANPDQVLVTTTCGGREHRLSFQRGALCALDHEPGDLDPPSGTPEGRECQDLLAVWASGASAAQRLDLFRDGPLDFDQVVELFPLLRALTAAANAHVREAFAAVDAGTLFRIFDIKVIGEARPFDFGAYGNLVPCALLRVRPSWLWRVARQDLALLEGRVVLDADLAIDGQSTVTLSKPIYSATRGEQSEERVTAVAQRRNGSGWALYG
jgi:hypothetical protein